MFYHRKFSCFTIRTLKQTVVGKPQKLSLLNVLSYMVNEIVLVWQFGWFFKIQSHRYVGSYIRSYLVFLASCIWSCIYSYSKHMSSFSYNFRSLYYVVLWPSFGGTVEHGSTLLTWSTPRMKILDKEMQHICCVAIWTVDIHNCITSLSIVFWLHLSFASLTI